uniref:Uncharacterized protein n=1 Tax=Branchiostoma floridae TaxID=7739 RepID=C3ZWI1_BRAFL|eukprot:XP_002587099.1 hypothetical protein BRAFLDRAFT_102615 [Branchiostoma floridae]
MAEEVNGEQIQQNLDDMSQDLMATTTEAVAIEQQETDMTNLTGDGSAAPVAGEDVPPGSKINSTKDDDDDRILGGFLWLARWYKYPSDEAKLVVTSLHAFPDTALWLWIICGLLDKPGRYFYLWGEQGQSQAIHL